MQHVCANREIMHYMYDYDLKILHDMQNNKKCQLRSLDGTCTCQPQNCPQVGLLVKKLVPGGPAAMNGAIQEGTSAAKPYTLHPTPYTPHATPYIPTLHRTPCTLHPTPYIPHPTHEQRHTRRHVFCSLGVPLRPSVPVRVLMPLPASMCVRPVAGLLFLLLGLFCNKSRPLSRPLLP